MTSPRLRMADNAAKMLRFTIALMYIFMGMFIGYRKWFFVDLSTVQAYGLSALLLAYGLYRANRALSYKTTNE